MGVVLINIKNDELSGLERRNLAAQLAADGAAAAGDEDGLSEDPAGDDAVVRMHRCSPQKILDADVLDLVDQHIAIGKL